MKQSANILMASYFLASTCLVVADDPVLNSESYATKPNWEAFNNRIVVPDAPLVKQRFGFSHTKHAGKAAGEIGGTIWRTLRPSSYAKKTSRATLQDKLSASGVLVLKKTTTGSGVGFGWFRSPHRATGRPINSLAWYLDGEGSGARMLCICVTGKNRQHGAFITQYERGKKFLPLKPDGTRHTWSIDYDPLGNGGRGTVQMKLGDAEPVEVQLPEGMKNDPTVFDRFGFFNLTKGGGPIEIYLGDLILNGERIDFSTDPEWEGRGNTDTFRDNQQPAAHDFGFSNTNFAGGKRGEIGGILWRAEKPFAYFADRVGELSLQHPITAQGRIVLVEAGQDSAAYLGFFDQRSKDEKPETVANKLGIYIEGPSRIGHYFRPVCATSKGAVVDPKKGPVLPQDGKPRLWTLKYDPTGNSGHGTIRVTLGDKVTELKLPRDFKSQQAQFNRFGITSVRSGGTHIRLYVDDVRYTSR